MKKLLVLFCVLLYSTFANANSVVVHATTLENWDYGTIDEELDLHLNNIIVGETGFWPFTDDKRAWITLDGTDLYGISHDSVINSVHLECYVDEEGGSNHNLDVNFLGFVSADDYIGNGQALYDAIGNYGSNIISNSPDFRSEGFKSIDLGQNGIDYVTWALLGVHDYMLFGLLEHDENDAAAELGIENNFLQLYVDYTPPNSNLILTPISHDFGNIQIGQTTDYYYFTLESTGNWQAEGSISVTGSNPDQFELHPDNQGNFILSPGESWVVGVRFSPTSDGTKNATVYVNGTGGTNSVSSSLFGNGISSPQPNIVLTPISHDFGNKQINTSSSYYTFTLENTGNAEASGDISLTGTNTNHFQIHPDDDGTFTLSASNSRNIRVLFAPISTGTKNATLYVDGSGGTNNVSSSLTGNGTNYTNTINIPQDYPTIQQGLNVASSGDLILVSNGIYVENITWPSVDGIKLIGSGIEDCIIDGNNQREVIKFQYVNPLPITSSTEISGFTITNGSNSGIYSYNANPNLNNLEIIGNSAPGYSAGGGIFLAYSSPIITDISILNNSTPMSGGGIFIAQSSNPVLNNVTISNNNTGTSGSGGGVCIGENCNPTFTNVLINNNTAQRGGGVSVAWHSDPTFTNVIIEGNTAHYYGGGIRFENQNNSVLTNVTIRNNSASMSAGIEVNHGLNVILTNSIIANNTSDSIGGGISLTDESNMIVNNCLIRNNTASTYGGGFALSNSNPVLTNVTITGNSANTGSAIRCTSNSNPIIKNCILWNDGQQEISLSSSSVTATYSNIAGGWTGAGNINAPPLFVDEGNNDYHLQNFSQCIGAGTISGAPSTDIEGNSRPNPAGSDPDIGAYENVLGEPYNSPPVINITGTFEAAEDLSSVTYDFNDFCSQLNGETDILTLSASNSTHINVTINDFDVIFESNTLNWNGTEYITFYLDDNVSEDIINNEYVYLQKFQQDAIRDIVNQTISVTINPVNDAPTIVLPDDFPFFEDNLLYVDFGPFINDVDGDDLNITYSGNTEIIANISNSIVVFESTENWYGTETLTFVIDDNVTRATAEDDVDVIVTPVNDPPTFNFIEDIIFPEDDSTIYDFSNYVIDVDNSLEDLTLSWTGNDTINIVQAGWELTFSSNVLNWNGTEEITFTIDDNTSDELGNPNKALSDNSRSSTSETITIYCDPINDPPTIILPDDFTFNEDEDLIVDFTDFIDDIDLDDLTLTVTGNTEITVDIVDFEVTFGATEDWNGTEALTFIIDDNVTRATAEDVVDVIVLPVNDDPTIILPDDLTFEEDDGLVVDFVDFVDDVDLDVLTLSATGNTEVTINIVDLEVTFGATADWNGTETLTFTVDDGQGARISFTTGKRSSQKQKQSVGENSRATADDVVDIIVTPMNDDPTIVLPDDFTFEEDDGLGVDFTDFIDDIDLDVLTLTVTGNTEITVDIVDFEVTFGATEDWNGTETLTFIIDDNVTRATAEDDVDVIVTAVNDEPVLNGFFPEELTFTVVEDSSVTFSVDAEDIDSNLIYAWFVNNDIQTENSETFIYQFPDLGTFEIKSEVSDEEYQIDTIWDVTVEEQVGTENLVLTVTELKGNYPNPFNPTTKISYSIVKKSIVQIDVYNIKGHLVKSLINRQHNAGNHSVIWNGKDSSGNNVCSGLYLYKLNVNGKTVSVKKCLLLK